MSARVSSAASWFGRFLELRLRAFIYALFALVGFILGVIVTTNMTVASIHQFEAGVKQQVLAAND